MEYLPLKEDLIKICNMNLEEFVSESMKQIISALKTSTEYGESNGVKVVTGGAEQNRSRSVVSFDVAITSAETSEAEGKAGIKVFSILDAGVSGKKGHENSTVSRVQFSLLMELKGSGSQTRAIASSSSRNKQAY